MSEEFTHFDEQGATRMVDVSDKSITKRVAVAEGFVEMQPETLVKIRERKFSKGDVFEVARLAGIMATKKTSDLIPLCHAIALESTKVNLEESGDSKVRIEATVVSTGKTGVEMEALTAVSVAALTIYDMCKSVDREMAVTRVQLLEKQGGKSGEFRRVNPTRGDSSGATS